MTADMQATGTPVDVPTDYDPDLWIEVPLVFPLGPWADAAAWARDIAAEAALRDDERAALEQRARGLAESDWPATRRFWYFPVDGGYEAIVHVIEVDDVVPDEEILGLLRGDDARVTDAVISRIEGVPHAWRCAFVVAEDAELGEGNPVDGAAGGDGRGAAGDGAGDGVGRAADLGGQIAGSAAAADGAEGAPAGEARMAMGVLRAVRAYERSTLLVELIDIDLAVIGAVMPDVDQLVRDLRPSDDGPADPAADLA